MMLPNCEEMWLNYGIDGWGKETETECEWLEICLHDKTYIHIMARPSHNLRSETAREHYPNLCQKHLSISLTPKLLFAIDLLFGKKGRESCLYQDIKFYKFLEEWVKHEKIPIRTK